MFTTVSSGYNKYSDYTHLALARRSSHQPVAGFAPTCRTHSEIDAMAKRPAPRVQSITWRIMAYGLAARLFDVGLDRSAGISTKLNRDPISGARERTKISSVDKTVAPICGCQSTRNFALGHSDSQEGCAATIGN
jgi:hypothetical protein